MILPRDKIIQGDCRTILAGIPEASVDIVFADPPYNLQLSRELWRPNQTRVDAVDDAWDQFTSYAEYDEFTRQWLGGCRRVLKDNGTIWIIGSYHNIYRVGTILQDLDFWILNDIVWIKNNPMPNFRGVRFTNAHETLLWAQKTRGARYTFNHRSMRALNDDLQMRSDWYLPLCTGKERIKENGKKVHNTQKPEALLYRILLASSNPGDIVLDPFFGTGTTGVAAKKMGRHFIGIELEPKYIDVARERISAASPLPEEVIASSRKEKPVRIPFGTLLESGLLKPGQVLFARKDGITATIQVDGHIRVGDQVGSIHAIARALTRGPSNGWDFWSYEDDSGQRQPINALRQKLTGKTEADQ